ncbi:MAG: UDP-N-acetylmuramate--L-alanine ligase [Patescibacteria group bacterium]
MTELNLNIIKKIYFLGIGGIGMSALALLFKHEGKDVSGSDTGFSNREGLVKAEVPTFEGYHESHITPDIDIVVYTLATPEDNIELIKARELGLPVLSYAAMLGEVSRTKKTIAICGTHGKTTTTAMIAHMMIRLNLSPSVIVGSLMKYEHDGIVEKTNYIPGTGDYLVAESCEYKKSFLNINPTVVCITNIDADHLDFYGNIENIISSFKEFIAKLPPEGIVIADMLDENSQRAVEGCNRKVIDSRSFLDVSLSLKVPGLHNKQNASVALAVSSYLGIKLEDAKEALKTFGGTWRRFEYKGNASTGALIYDDYAHHPHEILATLNGAREAFPQKKLTVVFEPHLYSRTKEHFENFAEVLSKFDTVYLTDIYAAREKFDGSISSGLMIDTIKKNNPNAFYISEFKDIAKKLNETTNQNDVVITMGAGTIGELAEILISQKS